MLRADDDVKHCRLDRQRNDTYLVRSDAGVIMQVGKSCMTDFLGADFIAHLTCKMESMPIDSDYFDDLEGFGGRREPLWQIEQALTAVAAAVRTVGWTSRSKSNDAIYGGPPTTADIILEFMLAEDFGKLARIYPDIAAAIRGKSEVDRAAGLAALAWARNIPANVESDYLSNLRVACMADVVTARTLGIVASAVASHARAVEREAEEKRARMVSGYIGRPGDKIGGKLTAADKKKAATITAVNTLDNDFDRVTSIVKLVTDDGNRLCWFASGSVDYKVNDRVTVRGSVKKHSEFRGVKETHLTRCTLLPVEAA